MRERVLATSAADGEGYFLVVALSERQTQIMANIDALYERNFTQNVISINSVVSKRKFRK